MGGLWAYLCVECHPQEAADIRILRGQPTVVGRPGWCEHGPLAGNLGGQTSVLHAALLFQNHSSRRPEAANRPEFLLGGASEFLDI